MGTTSSREEAHRASGALKALRDEIRRDLRSAGFEAKRQWSKLEPSLKQVERVADDISASSVRAVQDTVAMLRDFRDMLTEFGHAENVASHLLVLPVNRAKPIHPRHPAGGDRWTIRKYMTSSPHTIAIDRTLADAHTLMRRHRIRHLPVLDRGELVGLVSERDLHWLETLKDVRPAEVTVEEAMSQDVFVTASTTSIARVARTMARRKLGSAVVVDGGQILGIFSTVDALRALADLAARPIAKELGEPKRA